VKENRVVVLQNAEFQEPKTARMAHFFGKIQEKNRWLLVLGESQKVTQEMTHPHLNLVKSLRNLPKKEYIAIPQLNAYELAKSQDLVVLESALGEFLSILGAS